MIVVDASALLAIYINEPERPEFVRLLGQAEQACMSAINAWEVLVRASRLHGEQGRRRAEQLLTVFPIEVVAADWRQTQRAVDAFESYGRPSPAGLNLGDCYAYALARELGAPLLFKGDDFSQTDVTSAR